MCRTEESRVGKPERSSLQKGKDYEEFLTGPRTRNRNRRGRRTLQKGSREDEPRKNGKLRNEFTTGESLRKGPKGHILMRGVESKGFREVREERVQHVVGI